MKLHLIEGEAGCAHAAAQGCVAVVVDALRASATAAMLLHHGAREILVVSEVEAAFAAKRAWPDALLYGERGGLPPAGFDHGNSPLDTAAAKDRRVVFTTTNGARCLNACAGAAALYLGSTTNAAAVARAAAAHGRDIVLVPAGQRDNPAMPAPEDWSAAAAIARHIDAPIGEGRAAYAHWCERIDAEGIAHLFQAAPHADTLRKIGLDADIAFCARVDVTDAVPMVTGRNEFGLIIGASALRSRS